jgi:hypothetical protein
MKGTSPKLLHGNKLCLIQWQWGNALGTRPNLSLPALKGPNSQCLELHNRATRILGRECDIGVLPFQGWRCLGAEFPGRCPGLMSHSPSGWMNVQTPDAALPHSRVWTFAAMLPPVDRVDRLPLPAPKVLQLVSPGQRPGNSPQPNHLCPERAEPDRQRSLPPR